jgi:hypothetical protein
MTAPAITMDQVLGAFGQPATVQILGSPAITTTVMWLPQQTDLQPGAAFSRHGVRRILAVPRDDVPDLPRGARIVVGDPPNGDTTQTWVVDGMIAPSEYEQLHGADHHRAIVIPEGCDG